MKMDLPKTYVWAVNHRHPIFLGGLLVFFIVPELLEMLFNIVLPFQVLISLLIIPSILLIQTSPSKRFWSYGLIGALLIFIAIWKRYRDYPELIYLEKIAYVLLFIYFSFITFYLFRDLARSKTVTTSMIIGAFA